MVKRRSSRRMRRASVSRRSFKRSRSKPQSGFSKFFNNPLVQGAVYGKLRSPLNNFVKTQVSNVGLPQVANLSDEVLLIGTAWGLGKFIPNKEVRKLTKTAQTIESERIFEGSSGLNLGSIFGTSSASTSTTQSTNGGMQATF